MNKFTTIFLLVISISCDLVVDKEIKDEKITLLSPGDKDTNDAVKQYFWWEENKQIEEYRLQIVHPSFDKPSIMYVDTILKGKFNFSKALIPDDYEWRVRGENFSSKTTYFTRSLRVDTSYNISQQQMVLLSPSEGAILNNSRSVTLRWEKIPLASSYEVRIETVNSTFTYPTPSFTVYTNELVLTNLFNETQTFEDITYKWSVTAFNNKSNTQSIYNPGRSFTVKIPDPIIQTQ